MRSKERQDIVNGITRAEQAIKNFRFYFGDRGVIDKLPGGILGLPWTKINRPGCIGGREDGIKEAIRRGQNVTAEDDEKFLKKLIGRVDVLNSMGNVQLEAQHALEFLEERKDFWAKQKTQSGKFKQQKQ